MKLHPDELVQVALAAGLDEDAIRTDYSGRGMYGARCVGFVVNEPFAEMELGHAIRDVLPKDKAKKLMTRVAHDNMGLGTIIYFPGVTVA